MLIIIFGTTITDNTYYDIPGTLDDKLRNAYILTEKSIYKQNDKILSINFFSNS